MTTDPIAPPADPAPIPTPALIDIDLPCVSCTYNLRSRPSDTRCPECGLPVQESILRYGLNGVHARWFSAVRIGILLMGLSLAFMVAWEMFTTAAAWFGNVSWARPGWQHALYQALIVLVIVVRWWSTLLVAESPRPAQAQASFHRRQRRTRWLANLTLGGWILPWLLTVLQGPGVSILLRVLNLGLSLLFAAFCWTFFDLLAEITTTAAHPRLGRRLSVLGWAFAGSVLLSTVGTTLLWVLRDYGVDIDTVVWIYLRVTSLPSRIATLACDIYGCFLLLQTYALLGRLRITAPLHPEDPTPWLPLPIRQILTFPRKLLTW